ncbi:peptide deformylase [Acidaminobacter hydrogenoformans]|uniref:Peptide deformylase n=1 Tax=Acidaminobacter hydrogenoformans DSM 2784 TaxID=1120920 RepID=A0A1G5RR28_9FIRM|nr:peptide deformylase [Acidaminobacter hydrogenoformans]SCZ76535.1 peptide deformylase [Acidaminobacter hydrogenoformans DSM 2784]
MAIREILLLGHDHLRIKCAPIEEDEKELAASVAEDLRDTLLNFRKNIGFGRAIAAPQIDALVRILYMNIEGEETVLVNPVLEPMDKETFYVWDDCFSFPGLEVWVRRFKRVRLRYLDLDWNEQTLEVEGDLAELLQHEYDHLDGILAVDHAQTSKSLRFNRDKMGKA